MFFRVIEEIAVLQRIIQLHENVPFINWRRLPSSPVNIQFKCKTFLILFQCDSTKAWRAQCCHMRLNELLPWTIILAFTLWSWPPCASFDLRFSRFSLYSLICSPIILERSLKALSLIVIIWVYSHLFLPSPMFIITCSYSLLPFQVTKSFGLNHNYNLCHKWILYWSEVNKFFQYESSNQFVTFYFSLRSFFCNLASHKRLDLSW